MEPAPDTAAQRLGFLAAAGEVLASSLDYTDTLTQLARLAVPALADLCIIDVVEDGALRRVATVHVQPTKAALADQLQRDYSPWPDSPQPAARVLRTGAAELLADITPDVLEAHTRDETHADLLRAIGVRSHLAVPLVARGATVGVLSLGISESDRRYTPADVALAQDLARPAALAVDNARLYALARQELAERRRAEDALRLSEERFRAIVEQAPLSTQLLAPDGRTIQVNRAWELLWGVRFDQIPDYNILADPQLEALGITPLLRRAFAGEAVDLPATRYDPNDTLPDRSRYPDAARWVRAFAYPIRDAQGAVRQVVLVHEDVSEARTREQRLRASEERLRRALAAGQMNVWDWDLQTGQVECSENAREFWGRDVGCVRDFLAAIHPEDVVAVEEAGRQAVAGGGAYWAEYRIVSRDGSVRWVQSRGRVECGPDGEADRILGVTIDVTGLKVAEETTRLLADAGSAVGASLDHDIALQQLSRLLVPRLADWCAVDLLTSPDTLERVSIHHQDPDRVRVAQELFARFPPRRSDPHGAGRVIETGQPDWVPRISEAMLGEAIQDPAYLAALRELQLHSLICVPLIARGEVIGTMSLLYAESGREYQRADVEFAMDLARRVATALDHARLYQQLRAEDRRKDEFLATLAHELRNPLAPIRTGLALLRASTDPAATERTRLVMERQLGHMVRLIDELLDLSRVTRGMVQLEVERLDLSSIVATAVEASRPLLDQADVQLVVRLPDAPVVLDADRTRLSQILSNLLNNAAKFTPAGGRVELEAVVEPAEVLITVRDTGIGIPPEMLGPIFEMFTQVGDSRARSQTGLGIGLTLVRRLVDLHGGRVWAESEGAGRGSTFRVRLPLAASAAESVPEATPAQQQRTPASRTVLIVDDNVDAAEMLATLLGLDGHDVRTAHTGSAALEIARQFHPQIAFLDIGLPGMSGYELAARLRAEPRLRRLTLVAVTGWGQDEDRRQSIEAGFDHHLTKPVEPEVIQALVAHL